MVLKCLAKWEASSGIKEFCLHNVFMSVQTLVYIAFASEPHHGLVVFIARYYFKRELPVHLLFSEIVPAFLMSSFI